MAIRSAILRTLLILSGLSVIPLSAQEVVSVRVLTQPSGARFTVDGMQYTQPTSFSWPVGSKHVISVVYPAPNTVPDGTVCGTPQIADALIQYDPSCRARYLFNSWIIPGGTLVTGAAPSQTITADKTLTFIQANFAAEYKVDVRFFDRGTGVAGPSEKCLQKASSLGPKPPEEGSGVAIVGGQCLDNSTFVWAPAGVLTLQAVPFEGFVFKGWTFDGSPDTGPISSYELKGPTLISPRFEPAKRVRFYTNPFKLRLRIDSTEIPTIDPDNYVTFYPIPGYFDWAGGSKHVIAAVSPQVDIDNKQWVFANWSNGMGQDAPITIDNITNVPLVLTANFVRGINVSFLTDPQGLKLNIQGRDNWPSTNFIWGSGLKYTVTAPAEQTDARGRKYLFKSWSNDGPATQEIVPQDAQIASGIRLVAKFEAVPQAIIRSSIAGMKISVDGADCASPCRLDKPAGTELKLSVPAQIQISAVSRYEFTGWSDGNTSPARSFTLSADSQTVTANFRIANRLMASADPAEGATFQIQPASPDGFYPSDSQVTVVVEPKPGFKFRRWDGDLSGTVRSGTLLMSMSHVVHALLDRVPYVAPAGVKNAAADLAEPGVAAGSLVAIYGASLSKEFEAGPSNPLSQTLARVVVLVEDRILGLVYVSPEQINAQIPSDLEPGKYKITVRGEGASDVSGEFEVVRNAPGLFANPVDGVNYAAALHEDGTPITPASPAKRTELVSLIGTGFGPYARKVIDGFPTPSTPAISMADPVDLFVSGVRTTPAFAGAAPGLTGMTVTKFRIGQTGSSTVEAKVVINGRESNTVILPVE